MINQFHGAVLLPLFRSLRQRVIELAFAKYGTGSELAVMVSVLYGSVQPVFGLSGGRLRLIDQ